MKKYTIQKTSRVDLIEVIKHTPLVSIDLIVRNGKDQILVGLRTNEPAKGFWFVPGGRILKNERITEAFKRSFSSSKLLAPFTSQPYSPWWPAQ